MNYSNGEKVCMWDRVKLGGENKGIVVFSADDDQYNSLFPKEQWAYMEHGVMIDTTFGGLVHYSAKNEDLELTSRGDKPTPAEWAELRKVQIETPESEWKSGKGESVKIGYINRNSQICTGHRDRPGTDHLQRAYRVECGLCGHAYGANGSDMHERRCPACQSGAPGIDY
ncbi:MULTISPECIES: hypothetical protein [Geobacter]|uniref:hypothetical protein n=1 Tax=Geobacter TaxID=28231 RepID=UPI0025746F83|nr:hypothetical protein [Geobacter sulfurreducens]BET58877.1 hypothetical protein GEO60473_19170 [Geobacter sp. 60473]